MSTLRVSNIEAKADVSSPTVDEKIKFTNSSGDVLFHLDGKTSGITTVGINTTGNTFTVNNTTGDVSFSGSVTSSGVSTFSSDVSIADKIVHIGDTDTAIRFPAADTITAETGGTERLRIDSSGRMLLGTNSAPHYTRMLLQGNSTDTGGGAVLRMCMGGTDPSSTEDLGTITFSDSGQINAAYIKGRRDSGTWTSGSSQPTYLEFATTADGASTPTTRMVIDSNGNMGIGVADPGYLLQLSGASATQTIGATSGTALLRVSRGAALTVVGSTSTQPYIGSGSNHDLQFRVNNGDVGRFDTSGRLLVGTSSSAPSGTYSSAALIRTQGNSTSSTNWGSINIARGQAATAPIYANSDIGAISFSDNAGQEFGTIRCMADATSGSGDYPGRLIFSTTADAASSPTERMRIDSAGDILVSKTGAGNGSNTDVITLDNDNSNTNDNLKTSIAFKRTGNNSSYIYSRISSERVGTHDTDIVFATNYGGSLSEELRIKANGGITFNGDTAAANALDDYEEGTWNPSPSFGGGQTGLTGNFNGTYTKVGRLVMAQFQLTFTNKGSSTGTLAVAGLPFNIGTNYHNVSGFSYMHRLNMGQTGGQIHIGATGSTMWIRRAGYSGNDAVLLDNGDFTNTTALWGGITYHV